MNMVMHTNPTGKTDTIYLFGDSHANSNFIGLTVPDKHVRILNQNSVTMHRIGRDGKIINMRPQYNSSNSIFILAYGEVDARCHVKRQMDAGREMDAVVGELVDAYFATITRTITQYAKIVICSIVPPISMAEHDLHNGPVKHQYGFVGSDEERVRFTRAINARLEAKCATVPNCVYFDFYEHYANPDGTLKFELSDKICHIADNRYILDAVAKLLA
jgi:hypothetical protein